MRWLLFLLLIPLPGAVPIATWDFESATPLQPSGGQAAALATASLTPGSWSTLTVVSLLAGVFPPGSSTASGVGYGTTTYTAATHGVIFAVPTTGYSAPLTLSFDAVRTATGPDTLQLEYSTTGAAGAFTPAAGLTATLPTAGAWVATSWTLPALLAYVPGFAVRVRGTSTGTLGATGQLRLDNVNIGGASSACSAVLPTGLALNLALSNSTTYCAPAGGCAATVTLLGGGGGGGADSTRSAGGNGPGGRGAQFTVTFSLAASEVVTVFVAEGGMGAPAAGQSLGGGGGGASAIIRGYQGGPAANIIAVAGLLPPPLPPLTAAALTLPLSLPSPPQALAALPRRLMAAAGVQALAPWLQHLQLQQG